MDATSIPDPPGYAELSPTEQVRYIQMLWDRLFERPDELPVPESHLQLAEDRLDAVGITVNRNAVPFDPRPPMVSSGVRIGTPALAARGFDAQDFTEVADIIAAALRPSADEDETARLRARVARLVARHPLYPNLAEGA
jgi:hypothetical protein